MPNWSPSLEVGRKRFAVIVGSGIVLDAVIAASANQLGARRLTGIHGVLEIAVAVLGGLLAGYLAGAIIGSVAAVLFVVLVGYASPPDPWLAGVPIVLLWIAIAAGAGAIATVLRGRAARATASEATARARAERVYAVVAHLAAAIEPEEVARITVREGASVLNAQAAWLATIDESGMALARLAATGFDPVQVRPYGLIALDGRTVSADVVRGGGPRWFANPGELADAYPDAAAAYDSLGFAASAVLPLATSGEPFGFISLHFREPRPFPQEERDIALAFASSAAQALERARLYAEVRDAAGTLQRSMLPVTIPVVPGFSVAVRYRPASDTLAVGGDWYEVLELGGDRLGIAVGDVAGKGVDAAAVMGRVRTAMRAYALEHDSPAEVLRLVNAYHDRTRGDVFATALYAVLDPRAGELRLASAGHLPPIIGDEAAMGPAAIAVDPPLGAGLGDRTFRETVLPLHKGQLVILYTDGVVERRDASVDCGIAELAESAAARLPGPVERLADTILEAVTGVDAEDDRALLVVRVSSA